jgi:hypothetical protein
MIPEPRHRRQHGHLNFNVTKTSEKEFHDVPFYAIGDGRWIHRSAEWGCTIQRPC